MLSRRSGVVSNGGLSTLARANDENAVAMGPLASKKVDAAPPNKTPASSKPRRAFVDISNRKKSPSSRGIVQKSAAATPSVVATSALAVDRGQLHPQKSSTTHRVEFELPKDLLNGQPSESTVKSITNRGRREPNFYDDEIERPYGLTWEQQLALEADDDNTVPSLEGANEVRANLLAAIKKQRELRVQDLKDEAAITQQLAEQQCAALLDEDARFYEAFLKEDVLDLPSFLELSAADSDLESIPEPQLSLEVSFG